MPKYSDFRGAIFDIDDTLLNNYPKGHPFGLHEESRLRAIRLIGKRDDIKELQEFTVQQNIIAFRDAPVHSLEGAVWSALLMTGLANGDVIDRSNPLFREIVQLKDEFHENTLRTYAVEVPGSAKFVRLLASHGFADSLAVATTAYRRDALLSLEVVGVRELFPDEHILTKDRFTHPKPHPEAFEKAFASLELDIPPEQVLAFEDDPRGIISAKAAGLYTCAITTRYTKKNLAALEVAPDLIAESFAEFEQLLGLT
jgi:HAD superfamily hydrolase (TIGR01509 family)